METRRTNKGGRPALADPAKHRHVLYLNDRENAGFLSQWEQSGVTSKSRFIARYACNRCAYIALCDGADGTLAGGNGNL